MYTIIANYEFCFAIDFLLRDRPFSLKGGGGEGGGGFWFLFRSEFFFRTTRELEYLFFLSRKTRIFFPEFHIRLYDKYLESDYFFFPPPKSEYFFQQHWESEYLFRKKPYPPPLPSSQMVVPLNKQFNKQLFWIFLLNL